MTGSERIDKVTELIESEIKKDKSPSKIADSVAQRFGISTRDLHTVFMFLTGQTLINYIKERKLMASYENIVNSKDFDAQVAVSLSGLGDQPAFNKVFKKTFGCTPKEAFDKKDYSLLKIRMTWDHMGNSEIIPINEFVEMKPLKKDKIFGVEHSKFEQIKEIIELQEIYGFDELESRTAYDIYTDYDLPLKDAFRFVSEYKYCENHPIEINEEELIEELGLSPDFQFAPEEEDIDTLSRVGYIDRIKEGVRDPEVRYVYFNCDMNSIYTTFNVIEKLHSAGETDVTQVDIDVINICAYEDIDVCYCKKAVLYYKEHATDEYGDDAFCEYMGYILENQPIEAAFSNIYQTDGWDDYDSQFHSEDEYYAFLKEYDPNDPFEKWAESETDYSDKYRIIESDYDD